jgi:hypothetical protein
MPEIFIYFETNEAADSVARPAVLEVSIKHVK